jgi:hypothetical protein
MSHLLPLLEGMREEGADARLLCLGEGGLASAARSRGLPLRVVDMTHPWDARALPGLRAALGAGPEEGRSWDVVHTHGMRANLPLRLLLARSRASRISRRADPGARVRRRPCLVTTVHSDIAGDYPPRQAAAYRLLDRATLPLTDLTIAVSADLERRLPARRRFAGRSAVVPSGLPPAALRAAAGVAEGRGGGGGGGKGEG